uniref:Uncharacterized protein n=1 Tax=Crocodylus porosus TaxID=8502 RepID=A0A7M4DZ60_CROPO
ACCLLSVHFFEKLSFPHVVHFTIPFFPVFPGWPGFCGQPLSWLVEHCPGHLSRWNPAPAAPWSASLPAAEKPCLSFCLQIHPPLAPTAQPPP